MDDHTRGRCCTRRGASGFAVALQAPEIAAEIGGRLVAQLAVLFKQLIKALLQLGRKRGIELRGGSGIALEDGIEDDGGSAAGKRQGAGRHLVDDRAEGKRSEERR